MPSSLFYVRTRIQLRAAARRKGKSFREINQLIEDASDDVIDAAIVEAEATASVNAIGDGKIIDAIINFFNSPLGKMLIDLLLKLLLGGLSTADVTGVAAT